MKTQITPAHVAIMNEQKKTLVINKGSDRNIFFLGSCRLVPMLNYMFNFCYLMVHTMIPESLNVPESIKNQMRNSEYLICEHIVNYNYFNTVASYENSVFDIYNGFSKVIRIPNYNEKIFAVDIIRYNKDVHPLYEEYMSGSFPECELVKVLCEKRRWGIERFYKFIDSSDVKDIRHTLPDSKTERIAITANHPANILFVNQYKVMKEKIFESEYSPQLTSGFGTFFTDTSPYFSVYSYLDKLMGVNLNEHCLNKQEFDRYVRLIKWT